MRFEYDKEKNRIVKQRHGVSLKDVVAIFEQAYIVNQKNDHPEQYRAIGWACGELCSVILEIRQDAGGDYDRLITAWRATKEEQQSYAENV